MGIDTTEQAATGATIIRMPKAEKPGAPARPKIKQDGFVITQDGDLTCEYEIDAESGIAHVTLEGTVSFEIAEREVSELSGEGGGTRAYFSGVVESAQFEFKTALERSCRNIAVRAAAAAYDRHNPKPVRQRGGGGVSKAVLEAALAAKDAEAAAKDALLAQQAARLAELEAMFAANAEPALSVVKGKKK
jgi:hypothetical protein